MTSPVTIISAVTTNLTAGGGSVSNLLDWPIGAVNEYYWAAGQTGGWVKFDLGVARIVTNAFWVQSANVGHGVWQWQGSTDDSSYANIGATFTLGADVRGLAIQSFDDVLSSNTTAYRYYKMVQQSGSTSDSPWLYGLLITDMYPSSLDSTGYVSRYGIFDRRDKIGVTTTLMIGNTGAVYIRDLVEGYPGDGAYNTILPLGAHRPWFSTGQTSGYLLFDFGQPLVVNEATHLQSDTSSQGTWQWAGSNDNSSWTNVGSSFTFGGARSQVHAALNGNATAYRWYRFSIVSGATAGGPYVEAFYFSIGTVLAYNQLPLAQNIGSTTENATPDDFLMSANATNTLLDPGAWAWAPTDGIATCVIKIDFGSAVVLQDLGILTTTFNSASSNSWQMAGSNDNSSFTNIGSTFSLTTGAGTFFNDLSSTLGSNTTAYRWYEMTLQAAWTLSTGFINIWPLKFGSASLGLSGYLTAFGFGDRRSIITVTSSASFNGVGVTKLLNGLPYKDSPVYFSSSVSGQTITFDFGSGVVLNEAIWSQDSAASHGRWKWRGSPDNSTWTDIGLDFDLGGQWPITVMAQLAPNTTSYRYYQLYQTSGATSTTPYLHQIFFSEAGSGATAWPDSAAFSGSGSLAASTLARLAAAAALSGSGSLSARAVEVAAAGASLHASGSLAASAIVPGSGTVWPDSASLEATGSMTAYATRGTVRRPSGGAALLIGL